VRSISAIETGGDHAVGGSHRFQSLRLPSICLGVLLLAEAPAAAYTDPGSGALLWQILVAGFVGALFYFRRITSWFKRRKGGDHR
jgi:hypothetical protein